MRSDGHVVVTDTVSGVSATLGNVETLTFADGAVQLQSRAELGMIAARYQNALGRQADVPGFELWGELQSGQGGSMGQIALDIINPAESVARGNVLQGKAKQGKARQGKARQGNAAHGVALLYQTLFGRTADAEGAAFWGNAVEHGVTLAQVADGMLASTEMATHALAATTWDFHF